MWSTRIVEKHDLYFQQLNSVLLVMKGILRTFFSIVKLATSVCGYNISSRLDEEMSLTLNKNCVKVKYIYIIPGFMHCS